MLQGELIPLQEGNKELMQQRRVLLFLNSLSLRDNYFSLPTCSESPRSGGRALRHAVGPQPVVQPPGRYEMRHEWSVRREWKLSSGSQANSVAGGPLLTMTALPLINMHFLIPVCFSLLCNRVYQTGMGVSPNGT